MSPSAQRIRPCSNVDLRGAAEPEAPGDRSKIRLLYPAHQMAQNQVKYGEKCHRAPENDLIVSGGELIESERPVTRPSLPRCVPPREMWTDAFVGTIVRDVD